jgi:hypothetical protein
MDSVVEEAKMTDIEKQHTSIDSSLKASEQEEAGTEVEKAEEVRRATENAEGDPWSYWTWNEELQVYIMYYEECYHTYDPEKQVYGKYTGEEDDSESLDSQSADEHKFDIDGEAMSGSDVDGAAPALESDDDFKEGVSCPL